MILRVAAQLISSELSDAVSETFFFKLLRAPCRSLRDWLDHWIQLAYLKGAAGESLPVASYARPSLAGPAVWSEFQCSR